MRIKFNSIRFKISVLYVAILGVILVIYSGVLYLSLYHSLYDDLDNELLLKTRELNNTVLSYMDAVGHNRQSFIFALRRAINLEGEHPDQPKIKELELQWFQRLDKLDLKEDYINFLDSEGRPMVSSKNLDMGLLSILTKNSNMPNDKKEVFRDVKLKNNNMRVICAPFYYDGKGPYIIEIGTSVKPIMRILKNRLYNIAVSIPLILLFAGFIGQLFAIRILKPVAKITETVNKITHEDLSARVKTENVDEEMKFLVNAFNDMISRLETSFRHIEEFSSHVAHELKTPLAIVRGESEIALRKEHDPEEYKRVIRINLEESKRMVKTIENLLLLAKLDYRPEIFKFEKIELTEFFREIYEHARTLAFNKEIGVNIHMPDTPTYINADKFHLRRLFLNIIDNAVKFTPKGKRISLTVKYNGEKVIAAVSDTGVGIEEKNLSKIFERFFHVDVTEQEESDSGNGLGLSIAQSIAKIHNSDIHVKSQPGKGSTFTVTLPLKQP
ncbi:MAG: hypothetical protein A2Z72_06160 [Omnitrophica bacterium RBG_13_46_9]|nr:MAG: hypothetical protein A2Z72_06160 [Omnitrophica bacterium RBG_13_46_9]